MGEEGRPGGDHDTANHDPDATFLNCHAPLPVVPIIAKPTGDPSASAAAVPSNAATVSPAGSAAPGKTDVSRGNGFVFRTRASFTGVTVTPAVSAATLNGLDPPEPPGTLRSACAPALPRVLSQA